MNCRICLDSILYQEAIGNFCKCKDVYMHEACAVKWFTPRIEGVSKGKAIDSDWKTNWCATCEVCNSSIDDDLVKKCVFNLKKESFKRLQKSINPIILPNVPQNQPTVETHTINRQSVVIQPHRPVQRQIHSNNNLNLTFYHVFQCLILLNNRLLSNYFF